VLLEIRDLLRSQQGRGPAGQAAHVAPNDAPEGPGIPGTTKI
jgi:large conductance mechanosensitive channel